MARDNRTLGKFNLDGIPPAPRGVPQIDVTFDIDANGILNVSAVDKATNNKQHITITASSGLNDEEIERMRKEAERHADDDQKRRDTIEARNKLDSLVYNLNKMIADNRDKIPEAERGQLEEAIKSAEKVLESDDLSAIQKATDDLTQASHKMAEVMYRATAATGADPGASPPPSGDAPSGGQGKSGDGVIDAEFEESN